MTLAQLHRTHRWVAVIAGIFFLIWIVSGIARILPGAGAERRASRPNYGNARVSPAQVAAAIGEPIVDMTLIGVTGNPVYRVQTRKGIRMVDAGSGEPFAITLETAEQILRTAYPGAGTALTRDRLTRHDWTYLAGPLPVYRIRAGGAGPFYFVSAQDGSIRKVTSTERVRALIGSMHTFEPLPGISGNPRIQKLAIAGAASLGLGAAVTGYLIVLSRRRKARAG